MYSKGFLREAFFDLVIQESKSLGVMCPRDMCLVIEGYW